MGADQAKTAAEKPKRPLDVLRERRGGMSAQLKETFKQQQQNRKLMRQALKAGPKTVPQLAAACGIEGRVAMWNLMAMRRYGEVIETGEQGDYLVYTLKGE
jgi:hypothetical protein